MSNKVLRGHRVLRGADPDEPETNFSREQDKSSVEDNPTRLVSGGHSYPKLSGPLVSVPPDHKFDPSRDRIDPEDITGLTFGLNVSGRSSPLPEVSSFPQATAGEVAADPSLSATSPTFRRRI